MSKYKKTIIVFAVAVLMVSLFAVSKTLAKDIIFDPGTDNVGIGTTNPETALQLGDKTGTKQFSLFGPNSNTASSEILFIDGNGVSPYWNGMGIRYDSNANALHFDDHYGNNSRMVIKRDSGDVGINNISPTYTLDVNGTGRFTSPLVVATPTDSDHATTKSYVDSAITSGDADSIDGIDSARIVYGDNSNKTTNVSSVNTALPSGFYDGSSATGSPTSTWYTYINTRHNSTSNNYGGQIAMSFYDRGDIYNRSISNGSYSSWARIWNDYNDGAGSGLDADYLDGISSGSYLRSNANDSLTSTLKVAGGSIIYEPSGEGGYIPHPGGGYYSYGGGITGAIRVCLPVDAPADMIRFAVDVYNYSTNTSFTALIGGYAYQTAGSNEWVNESAVILADSTNSNYNVRFGHENGKHCVYIGETTKSWSYPKVVVRDFYGGHSLDIDAYDDGWSVGIDTSFSNIDATQSNNFPKASYAITANSATSAGNADTVDSLHAGSFLRSNANDTFTASSLTLDGGAYLKTRMIGSLGTELGIGAGEMWSTMNGNISGEYLWLGGESGVKIVSSPDNMSSGWTGRHEASLVNTAGNSTFPGDVTAEAFYYDSDKRLKDNIVSLGSESLAVIDKLNPVSFTWKEDGVASQGFIAQEVEKIIPELVKTNSETDMKSIQYANLTAVLTAGIKTQAAEIKTQKEKINNLETELEILKIQVNSLKNN